MADDDPQRPMVDCRIVLGGAVAVVALLLGVVVWLASRLPLGG